MYVAVDTGSGREVLASVAQRNGRYLCPVCRSLVRLRKGTYRDPHFAHASGQGTPECELYHPSDGWRGPVIGLRPIEPPLPPSPLQRLSLFLHVHRLTGRAPASWGLEVLIPKAPSLRGRLTFDGGGDGYRVEVSCMKLYESAQTYPVNPDSETFRVSWVSLDADRGFGNAVQQRIDGLHGTLATVFVTENGNHKGRASGLEWGSSYYFVYRATHVLDVPPHILGTRLTDANGWCCSLVTLPPVEDEELLNWLSQTTGFAVQPAKRQWGVALPATHCIDATGRFALEPTMGLLLAVHPVGGDKGSVTLRAVANGEQVLATLQRGVWNFLRLGGFASATPPAIHVDGYSLPELQIRSFERTAPQVLLRFGTRNIAFASPEACQLLNQLRSGTIDLNGVTLPVALQPRLLSRSQGELEWASQLLVTVRGPEPQTVVLTAESLKEASEIIGDRTRDVIFDLDPFGYWWCEGSSAVATILAVSTATRVHAAWVLNAAGIPSSALRGTDRELATVIMKLNPPRWLTAHHRLAKARLQREGFVQ
jgi:Competence protein CoiA-like family